VIFAPPGAEGLADLGFFIHGSRVALLGETWESLPVPVKTGTLTFVTLRDRRDGTLPEMIIRDFNRIDHYQA
jgi:hypothetical protein